MAREETESLSSFRQWSANEWGIFKGETVCSISAPFLDNIQSHFMIPTNLIPAFLFSYFLLNPLMGQSVIPICYVFILFFRRFSFSLIKGELLDGILHGNSHRITSFNLQKKKKERENEKKWKTHARTRDYVIVFSI